MTTLTHNQQIKTTMDRYEPSITISTVEGMARDCDWETEAEAVKRCRENMADPHCFGHMLAWANKGPACLDSDYPGKAAACQKKHDDYAEAIVIYDGEIVLIEGRTMKATYTRIECSDPVHFFEV